MKIILVITNTAKKSLVFVTDQLKVFSLDEILPAVENKIVEGIYVVTGTSGTYIRSAPDTTTNNNIDSLSITGPKVVSIVQGNAQSTRAIARYIALYEDATGGAGEYITPVDSFRVPRHVVRDVFQSHSSITKAAAKEFSIDQFTLGAILIDEIARLTPFEPIYEKLFSGIIGKNTSVGVAQVSLETANGLVKKGLYNPNRNDARLPISGVMSNADRRILYEYVVQPKYGIRFAAALLHSLIRAWIPHIDISERPEILGTLYHLSSKKPHVHPKPDERGEQIAEEFYPLAKLWLTKK